MARLERTIAESGGSALGYFVTEPSENTFPALPVRENERVFVAFAGFPDGSRSFRPRPPPRADHRDRSCTAARPVQGHDQRGDTVTELATAPTETDRRRPPRLRLHLRRVELANRKLVDPLADEPTEWVEFAATAVAEPILGGLGNVDMISAPDFPDRPGLPRLQPAALRSRRARLADLVGVVGRRRACSTRRSSAASRTARVASSATTCSAGATVRVRYDWTDITATSARWTQSFSFDGGTTFEPNWFIELTRVR